MAVRWMQNTGIMTLQEYIYSSCHIQTKLIEDFLRLVLDCLVCTNI